MPTPAKCYHTKKTAIFSHSKGLKRETRIENTRLKRRAYEYDLTTNILYRKWYTFQIFRWTTFRLFSFRFGYSYPFLTGKYLPEKEMFYHYTANHYHTHLIINIIRESCIYFDGEMKKRRVAYFLN